MIEFDIRRINRENALDAFAIGNLANGEAFVEAAAVAGNADAFIGLHAGALAFLHLDVDDDRVARLEWGDRPASQELGGLLCFELRDDIHENLAAFAGWSGERFDTLF